MVATWNLPGSSHFAWFSGTRAECEQWKREKAAREPCGWETHSGGVIVSNRETSKWRYLDGRRVVDLRGPDERNDNDWMVEGVDINPVKPGAKTISDTQRAEGRSCY
jgi:hypothetical protein